MTQKKKIDIADWELLEIIEIQISSPQYTFSCIRKKPTPEFYTVFQDGFNGGIRIAPDFVYGKFCQNA